MKSIAARGLAVQTIQPLLLVALLVAGIAAQNQPDFSGRWVLERAQPPAPVAPRVLTVHHSPEELMVEREFEGVVRLNRYRVGIVGGFVGGVGRGVAVVDPSRTSHSVMWRGDRLVIESGTYIASTRAARRYLERTEEWSLDASGRLVLDITERDSGAATTTQTLTYRRE